MSKLEKLQSYQPDFYMDIIDMQEILITEASEIELVEANVKIIEDNCFLVSITDEGASRWEKMLNIVTDHSKPIEERRSLIQSKLRGIKKLSATKIKEMAEVYKNGNVDVAFESSVIKITFISVKGIPPNINDFKGAVEKVMPSHLGIEYIFRYLYWDKLESNNVTFNDLETYTWNELEVAFI